MFDLISCPANQKKFGLGKFNHANVLKKNILDADNLENAVQYKNKKILIMLKDYSFDEGAVKVIAEKKKACFLIDVSQIIKSNGVRRAILLAYLRTFLKVCIKHGAFYTFASFANKEQEIRSPDELCNICMMLGLNRGQCEFALKMLQHYL